MRLRAGHRAAKAEGETMTVEASPAGNRQWSAQDRGVWNARYRLVSAVQFISPTNAVVVVLLAASFLLTILPYLIYKPYFPFGGDIQHPVNVAYLLANGRPFPVTAELGEQYP